MNIMDEQIKVGQKIKCKKGDEEKIMWIKRMSSYYPRRYEVEDTPLENGGSRFWVIEKKDIIELINCDENTDPEYNSRCSNCGKLAWPVINDKEGLIFCNRVCEKQYKYKKENKCPFDMGYAGVCGKYAKIIYCKKHSQIKCEVCGRQATHNEEFAGGANFLMDHCVCDTCRPKDSGKEYVGYLKSLS